MVWEKIVIWLAGGTSEVVHALGEDIMNIEIHSHGNPGSPVTADRWIRFHRGSMSIDEKLTGSQLGGTWKDIADAVRKKNSSDFISAVSDLSVLVSFTWSQDWSEALYEAFDDVIWPA